MCKINDLPHSTHIHETLSYSLVIIHIFTGVRERDIKSEDGNERELFLHNILSYSCCNISDILEQQRANLLYVEGKEE